MATKLEKDIVRESTEKFDDREIMVTLTAKQEVSMKLKGMKSGVVKIPILELYQQLAGVDTDSDSQDSGPISIPTEKTPKATKNNPLVSRKEFLNEIRSTNAISTLDIETMSKFDGIIKELIDRQDRK